MAKAFHALYCPLPPAPSLLTHLTRRIDWNKKPFFIQRVDEAKTYDFKSGSCSSELGSEILLLRSRF